MEISYNQLSLGSLIKIGVVANLIGNSIAGVLFVLLGHRMFGFGPVSEDLGYRLAAGIGASLFLAASSSVIFIVGAFAARLLGRRAPSLFVSMSTDSSAPPP